jgi:hypothetical protein
MLTVHLEAHLLEGVLEDGGVLFVEVNEAVHLLQTLGLHTAAHARHNTMMAPSSTKHRHSTTTSAQKTLKQA